MAVVDQVLVSIAKFYTTGRVVGHVRKKETNNIDTSRRINLFSNAEDSNYVQLRFP